jgi:hypothetical protein
VKKKTSNQNLSSMDLLASLGLGTALPEQATRLTCHPGIIRALDGGGGSSNEKEEENNVRLGFHQCLNCGIQLRKVVLSSDTTTTATVKNKEKKGVPTGVACQGCHRVLYCSVKCRTDDATPTNTTTEEEEATLGHSPVICSLLRLCNDDEDAEEEEELRNLHNCNKNKRHNKTERNEAAIYRNQTERESYPATLFNILSEGPTWFVEAMTRTARQTVDVKSPIRSPVPVITSMKNSNSSRRGKRDRTTAFGGNSSSNEESQKQQNSNVTTIEIVLHIVGATTESELWGWDGSSSSNSSSSSSVDVLDAYTEASTNLITYLEELLQVPSITLRCIFIGPHCGNSSRNGNETKIPIITSNNYDTSNLLMKNKSSITATPSSMLIIETQCSNYGCINNKNNNTQDSLLPPPDVIIFFNPGFSCPDYDWSSALSYASSYSLCDNVGGGGPIPFLVTTNTELEGYADIKVLLDGGYININTVSRDILEAIDYPIDKSNGSSNKNKQYNDEFEEQVIFGMNPYVGLRVRQSGTMGNDLFVKNRWIICGLFQKMSSIRSTTATPPTRNKRNKSITDSRNKDDYDDDDIGEEKSRKRQRNENDAGGGDKNAKKKNPALI